MGPARAALAQPAYEPAVLPKAMPHTQGRPSQAPDEPALTMLGTCGRPSQAIVDHSNLAVRDGQMDDSFKTVSDTMVEEDKAAGRVNTPASRDTLPEHFADKPRQRGRPGEDGTGGHPECTQEERCVGDWNDQMVRHVFHGTMGDLYCVPCWDQLAGWFPQIRGHCLPAGKRRLLTPVPTQAPWVNHDDTEKTHDDIEKTPASHHDDSKKTLEMVVP